MWIVGKGAPDVTIESWAANGIRLRAATATTPLTRVGDQLTGTGVTLAVKPNKSGIRDDVLDGTLAGQAVHLTRDTAVKPPITVTFPGDRPYRSWLSDTILPLAQQDRESFKHFDHQSLYAFLTRCELYKHGSWLRQYMKGAKWTDQAKSFTNIIYAMDGVETSPHAIVGNYKFQQAVQANLKDTSKIGPRDVELRHVLLDRRRRRAAHAVRRPTRPRTSSPIARRAAR